MLKFICIVEGHGEVEAVPLLVRRIGERMIEPVHFQIIHPIRIPASKLYKEGELEKAVELAARKTMPDGVILIMLDCDDGCPAELGPSLLARAQRVRQDRKIAVVLAKKEFEAWFLASASSLRGIRGLADNIVSPPNPESIRDAKGWLSLKMGKNKSYSETTDQPALTSLFDIDAALSSDSFNKFYREIIRLLTP